MSICMHHYLHIPPSLASYLPVVVRVFSVMTAESTEMMQAFLGSTTYCGFLALGRKEYTYNLAENISEREFLSEMVGQRGGYITEKAGPL